MISQPCGSISASRDDRSGGAPEPATIRPCTEAEVGQRQRQRRVVDVERHHQRVAPLRVR